MESLQPRAEASSSEDAMDTTSPPNISRQEIPFTSGQSGNGVAPASAVGAAQQLGYGHQPHRGGGGGGRSPRPPVDYRIRTRNIAWCVNAQRYFPTRKTQTFVQSPHSGGLGGSTKLWMNGYRRWLGSEGSPWHLSRAFLSQSTSTVMLTITVRTGVLRRPRTIYRHCARGTSLIALLYWSR